MKTSTSNFKISKAKSERVLIINLPLHVTFLTWKCTLKKFFDSCQIQQGRKCCFFRQSDVNSPPGQIFIQYQLWQLFSCAESSCFWKRSSVHRPVTLTAGRGWRRKTKVSTKTFKILLTRIVWKVLEIKALDNFYIYSFLDIHSWQPTICLLGSSSISSWPSSVFPSLSVCLGV